MSEERLRELERKLDSDLESDQDKTRLLVETSRVGMLIPTELILVFQVKNSDHWHLVTHLHEDAKRSHFHTACVPGPFAYETQKDDSTFEIKWTPEWFSPCPKCKRTVFARFLAGHVIISNGWHHPPSRFPKSPHPMGGIGQIPEHWPGRYGLVVRSQSGQTLVQRRGLYWEEIPDKSSVKQKCSKCKQFIEANECKCTAAIKRRPDLYKDPRFRSNGFGLVQIPAKKLLEGLVHE